MVISQYDIYSVNLDPTIGSEIRKTRPCLILSPDKMNQHLKTVQIAPMTTNTTPYPWRVSMTFQKKRGMIVLDQIRTIDKSRLIKKLGRATLVVQQSVKDVIEEMLVK